MPGPWSRRVEKMRRAGLIAVLVLSLATSLYAIGVYAVLPLGTGLHPEMRAGFEAHRAGIHTHVFAAAFALSLGPFQFSTRMRCAHTTLHRWLGRLYLGVGVLVGGAAGLYMAFHAFGGLAARLGFGCLAIAWLLTGACAYRTIRAGDVRHHRRWMIRNFALCFAAVTLRLWVPSAVVSGIPFELAYPGIAWLCWIPNLLVAEWLIHRESRLESPAS